MTSILIILQAQQHPLASTIWMLVLMFLIFYFFMVRPQLRRQKLEKKFQQNLKKGDQVVTNGGMHAKIVELTNDLCIIETSAGRIKFERSAISRDITQLRYTQNTGPLKKEKDQEVGK
ncbi:MAG: preprotein translocase subunit YajC [Flavobacteriales bacterium AspAUS03]